MILGMLYNAVLTLNQNDTSLLFQIASVKTKNIILFFYLNLINTNI